MSKSLFSGPVNIKAGATTDNVIQIRSDNDTVATSLTRAELELLKGEPHVNASVYTFQRTDLASGENFTVVKYGDALNLNEHVVPRAGSLTGISVWASAPRAVGTADFYATIDGTTAPALKVQLNGTNTTYNYAAVAKDTAGLTVNAGQRVGVKAMTSVGWLPATADVGIDLIYEF
ncbi:MAG: hypothetical protein QMD05_08850 [Candidatus Brocadiaceae bacterium]|nr:hypothetical protein [Candidatus Brocadiaceae bacterium]